MYHDDCCAVEIEAFGVRNTGAFGKNRDCYSDRLVRITKKGLHFFGEDVSLFYYVNRLIR